MITFNMTSNFSQNAPINLIHAIYKFEQLLDQLAGDIDRLPIVKFDPRYTKPMNLSSVDIIGQAVEQDIRVYLDTYTQNYFSYKYAPVISHVKNHEPTRIYYNTRFFEHDLPIQRWVENLAHEIIHVFDHHSPYTFSHGENSLKGKDNSAPVKLSKILASMAIETPLIPDFDIDKDDMLIW